MPFGQAQPQGHMRHPATPIAADPVKYSASGLRKTHDAQRPTRLPTLSAPQKSVNKRQKTARKTTQAVGMHGECSETAGAWPYYLHRLRPAALWQFRTDATTDTVLRTAIGLLPAPF